MRSQKPSFVAVDNSHLHAHVPQETTESHSSNSSNTSLLSKPRSTASIHPGQVDYSSLIYIDVTEEEIMELNTLLSVNLNGPVDHIIVIESSKLI